jgi:hypothetical protein
MSSRALDARRLRSTLALIVAGLIALGSGVGAPSTARAQDRERARQLFEEAAVARAESRWEDVRRLLEESLRLYPRFSIAWNLVTALESVDDLPAAERLLIEIQQGAYGPVEPAARGGVQARLAAISRELGTLVVASSESAAVSIDGDRDVAVAGGTPLELRIAAGTHVLIARAEDGRALERSIDVERGDTRTLRFHFPEARAPGRLLVEARDPSMQVEVVGVAQGLGRLDLSLPAAEYRVGLAGGADLRTVTLGPGGTEHVVLGEDREEVWESPWLWGVLGVVIVGAAVTTGVVLGTQAPAPAPADFDGPPI